MRTTRLQNAIRDVIFLELKPLSLVAPFRLQCSTTQSNYGTATAIGTVSSQCTERFYFSYSVKSDKRVYTSLWEKKKSFIHEIVDHQYLL